MFKKKPKPVVKPTKSVVEPPKPKQTVLQWAEQLAYYERNERKCARKGCGYILLSHTSNEKETGWKKETTWYWTCCPEFLDASDVKVNDASDVKVNDASDVKVNKEIK
jgi:hypothetical protein